MAEWSGQEAEEHLTSERITCLPAALLLGSSTQRFRAGESSSLHLPTSRENMATQEAEKSVKDESKPH